MAVDIDKTGVLANRESLAEQFDYDWHARKLYFETHLRGHLLMQMTAYTSTRDHQWAAQHDPLFAACGADVEINVSGLAQANKQRPLAPMIGLLQQVMGAAPSSVASTGQRDLTRDRQPPEPGGAIRCDHVGTAPEASRLGSGHQRRRSGFETATAH